MAAAGQLPMHTALLSPEHNASLVECAERLRSRLRFAARETGLSSGDFLSMPEGHDHASPMLALPTLSASSPTLSSSSASSTASLAVAASDMGANTVSPAASSLYENLFGRHFILEPLHKEKQSTPMMRLISPTRPTSTRAHTASPQERASRSPRTPQRRNDVRTVGERLARVASSAHTPSHSKTGAHKRSESTTDLHNHPLPEQLLREQQEAVNASHKRQRIAPLAASVSNPAFQFPARVSPHVPSGSATSSALGRGVTSRAHRPSSSAMRHRLPVSRAGHARIASMPEQLHHLHEHYVPVRSHDPIPTGTFVNNKSSRQPAADAMLRPVHHVPSTPVVQTPRSHMRTQSREMLQRPSPLPSPSPRALCAHRRSISHSTAELSIPVPTSHDRTSGMTTPPAGVAPFPVTPKSMGSQSMSYGDYLIMSPSPQPRTTTQRRTQQQSPSHSGLNAQGFSPTRTRVRPLWAQQQR